MALLRYADLPWELWLRRVEALVRRCLFDMFPSLSELLVCSLSAEESESSVPSEPLPAIGLYQEENKPTENNKLNKMRKLDRVLYSRCFILTRPHTPTSWPLNAYTQSVLRVRWLIITPNVSFYMLCQTSEGVGKPAEIVVSVHAVQKNTHTQSKCLKLKFYWTPWKTECVLFIGSVLRGEKKAVFI